jgi:hypothetical protein
MIQNDVMSMKLAFKFIFFLNMVFLMSMNTIYFIAGPFKDILKGRGSVHHAKKKAIAPQN